MEPQLDDVKRLEPQAFSVAEFCVRNRISPATFHKLKNQGRAPRMMFLGRAIRISIEAEREWRAARERPKGAEAQQIAAEVKARAKLGQRAGALSAASPRHNSKRKAKTRDAR